MKALSRSLVLLGLLTMVVSGQTLPKVTQYKATSFRDVGKYLNPGGCFYLYMSTEQWGDKIREFVQKLSTTVTASMPAGEDKQGAMVVFHFLNSFLDDCGLRTVRGVGISSVRESDTLYQNRVAVVHDTPGPPKGLYWEVFTHENRPLDFVKYVPNDAVLATWAPLKPTPAWEWVKKTVTSSNFEPMVAGFNQSIMMLRGQGIDLDQWLDTIGPNFGLVVTASRDEKVLIPTPTGAQLEVPQAAVALVIEVKDDTIFQFIDAMLQPMPNVVRMGFDDMQLRSIPVPVPIPINIKPTIARMGSYLVLASNDAIVKAMNACAKGRAPSIAKDDEFQSLAKGMPTTAMGFSFLSRRFGDILTGIMQSAMAADPEAQKMAGLLGAMKGQASYGVSLKMPDGIVGISRTNFNVGQMMALQTAVVPTAVMAGMLLPALSQARTKARTINDVSNLKQIALGIIMYADDHNDQLPNDLADIWPYVGTGKVFVSPLGKTPVPANAADVRAGKCDYLYFTKGKKIGDIQNPASTPVACTKPGLLKQGVNVAYCDGHVQRKTVIDGKLRALIQAAGQH